MELATLICANTRKRAIEIALERSLPRSAEQNELRYNSTGANLQWAYIDSMRSLFGRPEKSLIIFDSSARKLIEWKTIINYIATRDFRCEWVGRWPMPDVRRSESVEQFTQELLKLGVCGVCKQPTQTVQFYEGPGLVHFIHGQGKECRVAVDVSNLTAALETLVKAALLVRQQQRVPAEMRREWLGPGLYEEQERQKADFARAQLERQFRQMDALSAGPQQRDWEKIEAWFDQKTYDRLARLQNRTVSPPQVIDPPKPALPAVVSRTTVRRVKFDD